MRWSAPPTPPFIPASASAPRQRSPCSTLAGLRANLAGAQAGYDATVANYRRTVLTAMQEIEDGITCMASHERAHAQALRASDCAAKLLDLATARYKGGVASYLDLISAQQSLRNAQRQQAQPMGQRLLVFLVKAPGGELAEPRYGLISGSP